MCRFIRMKISIGKAADNVSTGSHIAEKPKCVDLYRFLGAVVETKNGKLSSSPKPSDQAH